MTDQEANKLVEEALLRRALGTTVTEVREVTVEKTGSKSTTRITREIAPDVAAARLWLAARDPERWGSPEAIAAGQQVGVVLLPPVAEEVHF